MGNTNATSTTVEQDVKNVLEGKEEVSNEMLASLMWDSPPETLLAALKEDDLGLSEFVWLDKKQNSESDKGHERIEKSESDEARARRIAEIRRRIEEEVARRRMEMAQQEEEAAEKARNQAKKAKKSHDDALVLHCAHCSAPITKGINVIAATAGNGKVYCKAHSTQLLKARAYEQKAAKQHKARNNGKRSH